MAAEGVLFETAVSPTSWTLPSHLTLLTSLPPMEHGVTTPDKKLHDEVVTLAEVLHDAGYQTAGFVSGPFLHSSYGFSQGFDLYDDYTVCLPAGPASHQGATSPGLHDIVDTWLTERSATGDPPPFFIFLHMWDVHYDYLPPAPYDTLFDPDYTGNIDPHNYEKGEQVNPDMDPRDLQHIIALYDGEIRYTDFWLGKILERMRELGVFENTIIVVTADHGDEFFEHGKKGHLNNLYDLEIRVPLIVRYPEKVPVGRRVHMVRLMDIGPTLLSLAGVESPEEFGMAMKSSPYRERDLSPLLGCPGTSMKKWKNVTAFGDLWERHACVRTERLKYVHYLLGDHEEELFDLVKDPGETVNLLAEGDPRGAAMLDELMTWRERRAESMVAVEEAETPEALEKRLRTLGYVR